MSIRTSNSCLLGSQPLNSKTKNKVLSGASHALQWAQPAHALHSCLFHTGRFPFPYEFSSNLPPALCPSSTQSCRAHFPEISTPNSLTSFRSFTPTQRPFLTTCLNGNTPRQGCSLSLILKTTSSQKSFLTSLSPSENLQLLLPGPATVLIHNSLYEHMSDEDRRHFCHTHS